MPETTPDQPPVHPGDIVQITDDKHAWYPALLIVDEVRAWGVQASCHTPREGSYLTRLQRAAFEVVGVAALLSPETAKAREDSIASSSEPDTSPAPVADAVTGKVTLGRPWSPMDDLDLDGYRGEDA